MVLCTTKAKIFLHLSYFLHQMNINSQVWYPKSLALLMNIIKTSILGMADFADPFIILKAPKPEGPPPKKRKIVKKPKKERKNCWN